MEQTRNNLAKLTDQVNKQKIKVKALKNKMDNEPNEFLFETLRTEYNTANKQLLLISGELKRCTEQEKREKLAYRKSLYKIMASINEFAKVSRCNTKIKKDIHDIANIIQKIDKYIN